MIDNYTDYENGDSELSILYQAGFFSIERSHGSAVEGYYPHELILGYDICQMKGTHIGVSELTLEKSYQFGLLRI